MHPQPSLLFHRRRFARPNANGVQRLEAFRDCLVVGTETAKDDAFRERLRQLAGVKLQAKGFAVIGCGGRDRRFAGLNHPGNSAFNGRPIVARSPQKTKPHLPPLNRLRWRFFARGTPWAERTAEA